MAVNANSFKENSPLNFNPRPSRTTSHCDHGIVFVPPELGRSAPGKCRLQKPVSRSAEDSGVRNAPGTRNRFPLFALQSRPLKRIRSKSALAAVATRLAGSGDCAARRRSVRRVFHAPGSGRGAVEDNPMLRPFAGSPAIYVATQVAPVLFDLMARHMQRSEYPIVRRLWWMPQTMSAGLSIFSGVHNLNLAGKL